MAIRENLIVALVIISLACNIFLTGLIERGRSVQSGLLHKVQATQAGLVAAQAAQAQQVNADAIARCQQGNTFRSQDLELWTKVLSLSSTATTHPRTPSEVQAAIDFQTFLIQHDALRDCSIPEPLAGK